MRVELRFLALFLVLSPLAAAVFAAATLESPGGMSVPGPLPTSVSVPDTDAAKHAKRTACLQEAKARKLVGAQKAAFIKECIAKP